MRDDWIYTGLKPLGGGRKTKFLCRLSDSLSTWTEEIARKYEDFPVAYTEWTLTGHMNIVANLCDCLPYSDYSVKPVKGNRRSRRIRVARPDLDIHSKDWKDSWIFELKRDSVSLPSRANIENRVPGKMRKAYDHLQKIANGHPGWADHGCCALALTVWMNWLVKGKDRWQTRWSDRQKYEDDWKSLWGKWEAALDNTSDKLAKFGRVYHCAYRMPHSLVKRHYQIVKKDAKKENLRESAIPVAVLWVFTHKPWAEIATS